MNNVTSNMSLLKKFNELEIPLNKSPGIDFIPMRVLKDCLPNILPTLTNIINNSLMSATFPTNWKTSMTIPLLKEGDHEILCNNRPLSLLVMISKICEKIVLKQFKRCEHRLLVNPGKTKFLIIGTRQLQRIEAIEPTIPFLGENLKVAVFARDLGVILDPVLSHDEHITKLVSDCFNKETLKLILESLVLNYFTVRPFGPTRPTQT